MSMGSAVSPESVGQAQGKLHACVPPDGNWNGGSVLVLPGGGYQRVCLKHEGTDVCQYLSRLGYVAYALDYTLEPVGWHGRAARVEPAIEDGVAALRTIRRKAAEGGMDPAQVAVIGFSAGGHLATCIARALAESASDAEMKPRTIVQAYSDAYSDICPYHRGPEIKTTLMLRRCSCKPAPEGAYTEPGDQHRWCDMDAAAKAMPPTLIVASTRDDCCPPEKHADVMNAALESQQVPVRYIKKDFGPHGWGLRGWQQDLQTWLGEWLLSRKAT